MASCTFQEDGRGGWGVHRVWFIIPKGALKQLLKKKKPKAITGPKLKNVYREVFEIQTKSGRHEKLIFVHLNFQQEAEQSHILHSS